MTLEELKQKATASELALIEKVEALLVERDNEPAKQAARFMNAVLRNRSFEVETASFGEAMREGARQFFTQFPELRDNG